MAAGFMNFDNGNNSDIATRGNLGIMKDGTSEIFVAKNQIPERNMQQIIEMMGGIENIIQREDIVILKPNAQWWSQGMTNTNAMKAFIDMILRIPGFGGEIIIADNHHYQVDNSRAWTTNKRNGDYNYNELIKYFNEKGFANVTKYHWHDAGPNPHNRQGDAYGNSRVYGPEDGDGYVWCSNKIYETPSGRKCMMTYPIFTSRYSGISIDLMHGAWKDGSYLNLPIKLINFSGLNHHSKYAGVTASVKNLMGVVDMTCGHHGTEPEGFFNMHYIGDEGIIHRYSEKMRYYFGKLGLKTVSKVVFSMISPTKYFKFHYTGGALGYWMRHVRFPDLNIITAEWIGCEGRTAENGRHHAKSILASRDPVALDYFAAKYILLPATLSSEKRRNIAPLHDPERTDGPFRKFLLECHRQGIGNLTESRIRAHVYEYS
jgi:hypothetical protein